MRRASDITDQQLRDFAVWFAESFRTDQQRKWMSMTLAPHCTLLAWFTTSIEGAMHCPVSDAKKLVRRLHQLKLIKRHKDLVELIKM